MIATLGARVAQPDAEFVGGEHEWSSGPVARTAHVRRNGVGHCCNSMMRKYTERVGDSTAKQSWLGHGASESARSQAW